MGELLDPRRVIRWIDERVSSRRKQGEDHRRARDPNDDTGNQMTRLGRGQVQLIQQKKIHRHPENKDQRRHQHRKVLRVNLRPIARQVSSAERLDHHQHRQREHQKHPQSSQAGTKKRDQQADQEEGRNPTAAQFRQFLRKNSTQIDH